MKKILLTCVLAAGAFTASSQVIFDVQSPASIEGTYTFSNNGDGSSWGLANLLDPANRVTDTLKLASTDSLGCGTLNSLTGRIAVIYRGDCGFGEKALNAQNAGAVAVVIINNVAGIINMNGGEEGLDVTIPVAFISQADGATIRARMDAGDAVVVTIGSKVGYFGDDLGIERNKMLISEAYGIPAALAQNASEFNVKLGAWVFNYGTNVQTGVTLTGTVAHNATNVYTEAAGPFSIPAGDSLFVGLPTFSQSTYSGKYNLRYALSSDADATNEYAVDDTISSPFAITDTIYSLSRLSATTGLPVSTGGVTLITEDEVTNYRTCMVLRDPNANRLAVQGLYFTASIDTAGGMDINGQEMLVAAYEWDDEFETIGDDGFGFEMLNQVAFGDFYYTSVDQANQFVYGAFYDPFVMENNQRYLFCVQTTVPHIYFGYDDDIQYEFMTDSLGQIYHPVFGPNTANGFSWFGKGINRAPALGLKVFPATELGLNEVTEANASVYPNPAKDIVTVLVKGFQGESKLVVTDIAGKIVFNNNVNIDAAGKTSVNLAGLNNGMYIFNLQMQDGTNSTFNVVIQK
jgi:hypothetical protein